MTGLKELIITNPASEKPDDTFFDLIELEALGLMEIKIVTLDENLFWSLVNLRMIYLICNQIEPISSKLFVVNIKLKGISLYENRLINVAHDVFSHLPNLDVLLLKGNACIDKDYKSEAINAADELEHILMENCNYTCEGLTNDMSSYIRELEQCEKDYENISRENVKMRNKQKVCLIL